MSLCDVPDIEKTPCHTDTLHVYTRPQPVYCMHSQYLHTITRISKLYSIYENKSKQVMCAILEGVVQLQDNLSSIIF